MTVPEPATAAPPGPERVTRPAISGMSVAAIGVGMVLVAAGRSRSRVPDVVRAVVRGAPLPHDTLYTARGEDPPPKITPAVRSGLAEPGDISVLVPRGGSAVGARVAQLALSHLGVPYEWAGEDPSGWDCSGLVTWCLVQAGVTDLPSTVHTRAVQFHAWSGARDIPRDQCMPGDLVSWTSHIGIAIDRTQMVHAPTFGGKTEVVKIWWAPAPVIRRPKAYGT